MENKEEIYTALEEFRRLPNGAVPEVLDKYLHRVAATGVTMFPWCNIKPLLHHKLDVVMREFQERAPVDCQTLCPNVDNVKFEEMHKRLLSALDQFTGTPFTIQRICELVTNPTKHYKKADKFMRGIEKNLAVVTTVDSFGNRIVSESKSLVNGIDACVDQTLTPDQNKVGNNLFTEQSSSLCSPAAPVNSPAADVTEANVSGSSWFASLTTVVDSLNSYPKWRDSDTAVSSLCSVTSCGANSSQSSSSVTDPDVDDDELEPPSKRQLLEQTSSSTADNCVSTTAIVAPLLGQLLSSSVDSSERQSDDDDDDDDATRGDIVHSSNTNCSSDLTYVPAESTNNIQHEDVDSEETSTASRSLELSTVSVSVEDCCSREVDDISRADSDGSNTNSLTAELESDIESPTADLSESSSESSDNKADELDMSFTETDNANTCLDDVTCEKDDVTCETVQVSTTVADGPPTNAVNAIDIKLAATADVDTDDHRHFIGSDRSCSDLKHDSHMSESMLVSQVAMDIN